VLIKDGSVLAFADAVWRRSMPPPRTQWKGYRESLEPRAPLRGAYRVSSSSMSTTKPIRRELQGPEAKIDAYREDRAGMSKRVNEVMATAEPPGVVDSNVEGGQAGAPEDRYAAGRLANRLRYSADLRLAGVVDAGIRKDMRLDCFGGLVPRTRPPERRR